MSDVPSVRPMEEGDIAAVHHLDSICQGHPWTPGHFRDELARGESGLALVWQGPDSAIEGYLCVWTVADELHVGTVGVSPVRRRAGIGRSLMEFAHEWAVLRGAVLAHLEVRAGNDAAIALYAGMKYRRVGIRRGYYTDNGEDAHLMMREIGAPSA